MADVQRIKGIGPFYAGLIVVRATGFTDVLPSNNKAQLYQALHLPVLPSPMQGDRQFALGALGNAAGSEHPETVVPAPRDTRALTQANRASWPRSQ